MKKEERGEHTVFWWVGWTVLTIVTFFVPCYLWTKFIAAKYGSMDQPGIPVLWVALVFGSWMVLLVPLIIVMYNKVDRGYEDARLAREKQALELLATRFPVKAIEIEEARLLLPKAVKSRLKRLPKTVKKGQLVTLKMRDGTLVPDVFVFENSEIVGVYGRTDFPFDAREAVEAKLEDAGKAMPVDYDRWLRIIAK
jgi:uncharacterized membrane protein